MSNSNESKAVKFAFLIHPRVHIKSDLAMSIHPLCQYIPLPDKWLEWLIQWLPPVITGKIFMNNEHLGYIMNVPYSARYMLTKSRASVVKKIVSAVKKAKANGCSVVGLGILTAPMTGGGLKLVKVANELGVGITNGNALTAGATIEAVRRILDIFPYKQNRVKIAIVGATGSVGSGIANFLAKDGYRLLLIGRAKPGSNLYTDNPKLKRLHRLLSADNSRVTASVDMNDLRDQDIVVVTTSGTSALIKREHLKSGAIVYDDTQPRNTDIALREEEDILVIDGGWLMTPKLSISVNIDLPPEHAYACLVETLLLASNNMLANYCIGDAKFDQIEEMLDLFHESDFQLARFRSFGVYIPESNWRFVQQLIARNSEH